MRCSIIIPAFNAERFLGRTVASIREQDVVDWELVIVDDGSRDRTRQICDDLATSDRRIRVVHQPNKGLAAARNAGFWSSSPETEFLLFIDSDDLLLPEALGRLISVADQVPHVPAVYGDCSYIADDGRNFGDCFPQRRLLRDAYALSTKTDVTGVKFSPPLTFAVGNCISSTGQVLIRRWALEKVGLFDDALSPVADWDLWLRMSDGIGPLAFVEAQVMAYRLHDASMSRHVPGMRHAEAAMRLKHVRASTEMRHLMTRGIRKVDHDHRAVLTDELGRCVDAKNYRKLPSTCARLAYMTIRQFLPITWPLFLNAYLRGR